MTAIAKYYKIERKYGQKAGKGRVSPGKDQREPCLVKCGVWKRAEDGPGALLVKKNE